MKKRRTLALLMAGILTASALSIGASAEEADTAPQVGIEQQEEAASEKKAKKSADTSAEDGTVKEKKTKKSSDSTSETESSQKKHGKKAAKTAEPEGVIGKDAAKEAALADAGAEAEGHVRGRYTEKDGTGIYKVTFKAGGQRYKYRIDAMTGEILDKSITEITE
ncbi:MAG: PepSY domain-containing protein [Lachnospiraceae bacterium]|nr:PepSY domain-containing protein [Lachnospiraceae bacterium]